MAWFSSRFDRMYDWLDTNLGSAVASAVLGAILAALAARWFLPTVWWELTSWMSASRLDLVALLERVFARRKTRPFRVVVTRLSDDPGDRHSRHLHAILKRDRGGAGELTAGIHVIWYGRRILRFNDSGPEETRRARRSLHRLNADMVVTGRVPPDNDKVDLGFCTVERLRLGDGHLQWEAIPRKFLAENASSRVREITNELFKIYVLSNVRIYRNRRWVRLHTLPDAFNDAVLPHIVGPGGDLPHGTVRSFIVAFAELAERMTQRRGTLPWAQAAVKARQAECATIDKSTQPEAWARAQIALGDAYLEQFHLCNEAAVAECALAAFDSALPLIAVISRERAQALRGRSEALSAFRVFDLGVQRAEMALAVAEAAVNLHDTLADADDDADRIRAVLALGRAFGHIYTRRGGVERLREGQRLVATVASITAPDQDPILWGLARIEVSISADDLWVTEEKTGWLEIAERAAREVVNGISREEYGLIWAEALYCEALALYRRAESSDTKSTYERAITQLQAFVELGVAANPWHQATARGFLAKGLSRVAIIEWFTGLSSAEDEPESYARREELFDRAEQIISAALEDWPSRRAPLPHCWLLDTYGRLLYDRANVYPIQSAERGGADQAVPYLARALHVLEESLASVQDDAWLRIFRLKTIVQVARSLGQRTGRGEYFSRACSAAQSALGIAESPPLRAMAMDALGRARVDQARAGGGAVRDLEATRDDVTAILAELNRSLYAARWRELVVVRGCLHEALGDRRRDRRQRRMDYRASLTDFDVAIATYEAAGAVPPADLETLRLQTVHKLGEGGKAEP